MDFTLTTEQKMFKDVARKFVEMEIAPIIDDMETTRRTPRDLIKKMRDLNLYGIQYPEIYGGVGSSFLEYSMVLEELSRVYCSIGGHISVNALCAGTIYEFGTEAQRQEFLPDLICGKAIGSVAFTEPDTGSDPKAIRTTAIREGDKWIIGEMAAEVEVARYMTYATADIKSKGSNILVESARTRLFSSQVAHRAASNAMQVMGAYAYTREFHIERIFRDMKLSELYEGVNEIQRIISASALLR